MKSLKSSSAREQVASRPDLEESESGSTTLSGREDARGRGRLLLMLAGEMKAETGFKAVARSGTA